MEKYIKEILKLSEIALNNEDTPIGALVVKGNKIIGKGFNDRNTRSNVLGHAEINAIKEAQQCLDDWRLYDCDLYVTLEPCNMCKEIIKEARISKVYYLVAKSDQKKSYPHTKFIKLSDKDEKNYSNKLKSFFERVR